MTAPTPADAAGERTIAAAEVQIGDRLRSRDGTEMTVTRIEPFIFPGMIAFVEDSDTQWFKLPAQPDAEVTLLARG
ncbi:hypothetical protein [Conexibacter sp. DBS9H8]|uniref:hypothetical protein n=1 Tax=Conexibacter sp. DBS9H8 TaxID=2937801 RepID=UPI00200E5AEB|nr:hypothetical protein [Conexibacter sp. DBS9H8]